MQLTAALSFCLHTNNPMSSPAAPNVSAPAPSEGNAEAVVAAPAAVDPTVNE